MKAFLDVHVKKFQRIIDGSKGISVTLRSFLPLEEEVRFALDVSLTSPQSCSQCTKVKIPTSIL